ncbi:MAG: cytochrome c1 [Rhodanobacteraceae bacterium]|nr:cytochrome c1 [Rhodanobacteraceae bacterium]
MIKRLLPWIVLVFSVPAMAAGGEVVLQQSGANISDRASLQRGAQLYFNYCGSCHSLQYMRYSRLAKDLGLTEEQTMKYLNFTGAKFGETIVAAMPAGLGETAVGGEDWFGKAPPDLSLIARARHNGPDYIYSYLLSFYPDPTRPGGWNNTVFPNASMPHVLWERQGIQTLRPADEHAEEGHGHAGPTFDLVKPGTRTPEEYRQDARDITAFLQYVGEPAALDREKYGIWVILYLLLFTGVAYLLKHEYWKDVH